MEMPDQTPVQIAWVTRDLDAFFDHVKQEQQ
jgi:hypothetical protein